MRFKDNWLEAFWEHPVKGEPRQIPAGVRKAAYRKLQMLDAAETLEDLRVPPGNRLEKLVGDRKEHYSIRVNDRWRLCFVWNDGEAEEVEFCDYH